MESTKNIIKKAFLIVSFCAFLYIALGFSLQQSSLGKVHLCPYASESGSTCVTNNFTHLQHWLSFISSNIPEAMGAIFAILLLSLFAVFVKNIFNFLHVVKILIKRNIFYDIKFSYLGNIFSIGTIGSRAP